jgi:hypothetical protein
MTTPNEPGDPGQAKPFEPMPAAPALNEQELAPAVPVNRPKSVDNAWMLWMVGAAISLLSLIFIFTVDADAIADQARKTLEGQGKTPTQKEIDDAANIFKITGVIFSLIFIGLFVLFAYKMRAGRNWARITLTVLGALSVVSTLFGLSSASGLHLVVALIQMVLILVAVYFMYRPDANQYFAAGKVRR